MDSVFKELLGKTKHMGADDPLSFPAPQDPPKSILVGKKGPAPAKQGSSNRVLLRGKVGFKSSGNGE